MCARGKTHRNKSYERMNVAQGDLITSRTEEMEYYERQLRFELRP